MRPKFPPARRLPQGAREDTLPACGHILHIRYSSTLTLLSLSLSPFQSLSLSLSAGPDTGPETAESQECSAHTRNEQVSTKTPKCFGAHLLTTNPPLHWLMRERDRDVNCQKTKRLKDRILQHPKTNPPSPPHLILKFDRWPPPTFFCVIAVTVDCQY